MGIAKGLFGKEEVKTGKKASLPEVLEQESVFEEESDRVGIAGLLERGAQVQADFDEAKDDLAEIKEQLGAFAAEYGLEGLRHNKIAYTQRLQAGKKTVDQNAFIEALLSRGVTAVTIAECVDEATKQGQDFWVRGISVLD